MNAKEVELSSDGLKAIWLQQAEGEFNDGNKAKARRMRRAADNKRAWSRIEKELRSAKERSGSAWEELIAALLPLLLDLLKRLFQI